MVIETAPNVARHMLLLQEFSEKVMPIGDIEVAHLPAIERRAVNACHAHPNARKGGDSHRGLCRKSHLGLLAGTIWFR